MCQDMQNIDDLKEVLTSNRISFIFLKWQTQAIKTKNPATVQCDAFQMEIFSQEDALLSVPETSLLVAVATMTCQFVFSQFFLVWMPSGQDGKWKKEQKMSAPLHANDEDTPMATLCHRDWLLAETIADLQSVMSILFFACCNRLLHCGGQPIIQVGLLWIPHSRGWLVCEQRVCSAAMLLFLDGASCKSFALWGSSSDPTVSAYASSPLQDAQYVLLWQALHFGFVVVEFYSLFL